VYLPHRVSVGRPSWIPLSSNAVDNVNKVILGVSEPVIAQVDDGGYAIPSHLDL